MKPFALDTVLDYRKRLEDIAQQRFIEAQKARDSIQKKLDDAREDLTRFIAESAQLQQV